MEEFNVKLDRFEGPYTKLLEMIESRKLSITEIGLTAVADDYIAYIKNIQKENEGNILVDISQFIVIASTLMLMKVKSLLPGLAYTNEEEKQIHNLEHKLDLYKTLNQATGMIRNIFMKTPLFERQRIKYKDVYVFVPDKNVNISTLQSIAILTISSFKPPENLIKVALEQKLRIENVIDDLLARVRTTKDHSFFKIIHNVTHSFEERKKLLIVNFLALLELIRLGSVDAIQIEGGDITVEARQ